MSAAHKIIKGTWDEVLKHANEFQGHHVTVIVDDKSSAAQNHSAFDTSPGANKAWAEQFRAWAKQLPVIRLGDDSRDTVYEDYLK